MNDLMKVKKHRNAQKNVFDTHFYVRSNIAVFKNMFQMNLFGSLDAA